jgi:ABC-type glycerol-3-phosphate transport system substrate-binding protein
MKTSPFQMVLLGVFGVLGLIGIAAFALQSAGGASEDVGTVTVWGTFAQADVDRFLHEYGLEERRTASVNYVQKDESRFYLDLNEALAAGTGPDLIIIDQPHVTRYQRSLESIPYTDFPIRAFKDSFIDATETLLVPDGVIGIPLTIDPLVLYWNKDLLAENGIARPPRNWSDIFKIAQTVTKRDESGLITKSGIALGEFTNILHAKEIVSAMIMQAGGEIVVARDDTGALESRLAKSDENELPPAQSAVRYYTAFADPSKNTYSWNRSLPSSRDLFTQGDLALYIGTASELNLIANKNPNLNFDVAPLPQNSGPNARTLTTGTIYAFAIPKASDNKTGAVQIAYALTATAASKQWEEIVKTPSPQRTLLVPDPKDPFVTSFRQSALQMKVYPDPDPDASGEIFQRMIERITTGQEKISDSVQRADAELKILLRDRGFGGN